jgi:hypothetical protein
MVTERPPAATVQVRSYSFCCVSMMLEVTVTPTRLAMPPGSGFHTMDAEKDDPRLKVTVLQLIGS